MRRPPGTCTDREARWICSEDGWFEGAETEGVDGGDLWEASAPDWPKTNIWFPWSARLLINEGSNKNK